jgi:hypothetical protein
VSRPVSPHLPSGGCAARDPQGHRATEPPAPSGAGARKVRPSNAVPSQPTRRHRSDRREAFRFREAARRQRRAAESHGSVLREGPPLHGVRSSIATERFVDRLVPARAPEVKSPRHSRGGGLFRTRPNGRRANRSDALRSARAAEVDALVSTPLRLERLDPGSGHLQRRCAAPPPGRVAEASNASAPCGWAEDRFACRACATRISVRSRPPHGGIARLERGSSSELPQTWPETAGPHLKLRPTRPPGRFESSVTSPLRCRQRRRFGARGTSQPPGCEVSSSVELPRVRQ